MSVLWQVRARAAIERVLFHVDPLFHQDRHRVCIQMTLIQLAQLKQLACLDKSGHLQSTKLPSVALESEGIMEATASSDLNPSGFCRNVYFMAGKSHHASKKDVTLLMEF